jgi:hypothetical protein
MNGMQHVAAVPHNPAAWNIFGAWGITHWIDKEGGEATMATYRLADIVRSRSDLSDEEIERMNEEEAWQWIQANASGSKRTDEEPSDCQHR